MLELTTVNSALSITGVEEFVKGLNDERGKISIVAPTKENVAFSSKEVTKHNATIKTYEGQVDAIKAKYNEPLDNLLKPILQAIEAYYEDCKDYQNQVLAMKKEAFKDKARERFVKLATLVSTTGEIPNFDAFYEDKWYQCKNDDALDACIADKLKKQNEVADGDAVAVFSIKGSDKIAIVEDFLIKNKINYEKL